MRSWAIIAAILLAVGSLVYSRSLSPEARIGRAADLFMQAATAGDLAAVEALVAPDAAVSASEWVAMFKDRDVRYFPHRPPVQKAPSNDCGLKYSALSSVVIQDGFAESHPLFFKKVDGKWKVYQTVGRIC